MKGHKWLITFGVGFLLIAVVAGVVLGIAPDRGMADGRPDRGLPIVDLSLRDTDVETVISGGKNIKYGGNTLTLSNWGDDARAKTTFTEVEFKGRGNATWVQAKKPWQIKFSEKTDFLGLGKGKKWVLLANHLDPSQLRNAAAMYIGGMIETKFIPTGEFMELYIDGDYQGLYYATRKTEVGRNSVDLRDPTGVLVELDNIYGGFEVHYETGAGSYLVLSDAVDEAASEEGMMSFVSDFDRLELAARQGDWQAITEVADVRSFAEYFVLSELVMDVDAYYTSQYFYKDGLTDKIHAGPGWDFDMTFGNPNWGGGVSASFPTMIREDDEILRPLYDETTGEWLRENQYGVASRVFFDLIKMPEFQTEVAQVWDERMVGRLPEIELAVQRLAEKIRPAALADFEIWDRGDFVWEEEVANLLDWIRERYQFFAEKYGNGVTEERGIV